jgi:multiple sugar transport system permease protein
MSAVRSAPRLEVPRTLARLRRAPRLLLGYLLCGPALLVVLGLLVYPVLFDVRLSLTDAAGFETDGRFVGLSNYARLLAEPGFREAGLVTLVLVVVTAAIELVVGLLTALLLRRRFWGRGLLWVAVFVPWAFPSSFSAYAWYWLLLPPFHSFYTQQAIDAKLWLDGVFGIGSWQVLSVAVMNVWRGSSILAIFLLAGLNAIPEELLEYGRMEASSRWRYLWRVVLPLNRRVTVLAVLVGVTITYLDFASTYPASGGRIVVPMVGTLAYLSGILGGQTARAAAMVVVQMPVALALAWVALRFIEREGPARAAPPDGVGRWPGAAVRSAPVAARSGVARGSGHAGARLAAAGGVAAAVAVVTFHLFPVYYTAVQAVRPLSEFSWGQIFWASHPDWGALGEALRDPVLWRWGLNTVVIYGAALLVGLVVSLAAGYGLARFRPPGARWLARLMFACYFVPQMAVILPLFQMYRLTGLDNTLAGIGLVYLTLVVPFSTWLFYSFFLGLDREIEEHAWLDGSRMQAFVRVVLPMTSPVIVAAALFGVGMMASDLLYAGVLSLTNDTRTLPSGLGITAIDLSEWANVNAAILLAALPLIAVCAALGRYYVHGLSAALLEGA